MNREKYLAYLDSPKWQRKRRAVHERSGGICERCHRNPVDDVHHRTYARLYRERMKDLQGLCRDCHEFVHHRSSYDPAAKTVNVLGWIASWFS